MIGNIAFQSIPAAGIGSVIDNGIHHNRRHGAAFRVPGASAIAGLLNGVEVRRLCGILAWPSRCPVPGDSDTPHRWSSSQTE